MKTVLKLRLDKALENQGGSSIFYVLPKVNELEDPEKPDGLLTHFVFGTFLGDKFFLIEDTILKVRSEKVYYRNPNSGQEEQFSLCTKDFFRPGMKVFMSKEDVEKGEKERYLVDYQISTAVETWRRSSSIKLEEGILCYGQSILITAPPASGKSFTTKKILDSMAEYSTRPRIYRVLFGERKSDTLGVGTVNCDSSAIVDYQLYILYQEFTKALRDGYNGYDAIIGLDSLTRMCVFLTNQYAHSHMVSGGISSSAMTMVSRMFDMSGKVGEGTLTIIGTALWARPNNTWKTIYAELSAIATAEFHPDCKSGKLNKSRLKEPSRRENVVRFLGLDWKY
jgi:hypothetical protein